MCVRVCARAEQSRKPVDWTASVGAEACMRHAPHVAGPGTNEVPAANLAMELVRGPPRPAQAPTAGTVRQTPRPCSLLLFQYHAQGAAWW